MNNSDIDISSSYTFSFIGNRIIFIYMNISTLDSMERMFYNITKMVSIYFSPEFNTRKINNMNMMFCSCISLTSINLSNLDTLNVIDMRNMFSACISLTSINFSNFNTSNVSDMSYM